MTQETAVEMYVSGLVLDPNTQAPVVVLKDASGDIHLPIWIGIAEATSIASAIKQLNMARPLTHDLMSEALHQLGARVERVVITDLKDSTYFAELVVAVGDRAIVLDSRPSDAIALAVRADAPILVVEKVLMEAKTAVVVSGEAGEGASETSESAEEEESGPADFKQIDKDKWNEILAELDADDFKYKM